MGNYRSTRWSLHTKKYTVEMCKSLDISSWTQKNLLRPHVHEYGTVTWTRRDTGQVTGALGFELNMLDTSPWIEFSYTLTHSMVCAQEDIAYRVYLQRSSRARYYFSCPLLVGSSPCGRPVRILYLRPGARYFGCRQCYDLTYASSQTSHVRDKDEKYNRELMQELAAQNPNVSVQVIERFFKDTFW